MYHFTTLTPLPWLKILVNNEGNFTKTHFWIVLISLFHDETTSCMGKKKAPEPGLWYGNMNLKPEPSSQNDRLIHLSGSL